MKLIRLLVAAFLFVCVPAVSAQQQWQKIAPVGESFTVLMPTKAVEVSRIIPLNDKDSVPERVYYSLVGGRRYMVVSFVRTSPDRVLALSSFTEFMRGMEQSFKGKEGENKSLTFDTNLSDESGIVKQYRLQLGQYSGVARFMGDEKNFYAQMVIGADDNDPDARRFLTSFGVGQTNHDPEATNVVTISKAEPASQEIPPEPWPLPIAAMSGGVLNGKALFLSRPGYPKAARKNHDQGTVKVRIVIDEFGKVISAEAIEGPESLQQAAIDAAFKSRFTPTRLMGQPVKVSGVIIYNFVAQ